MIVVIQGMSCLGKSTLGKKLEEDIPNCKLLSLDKYKEWYWDSYGFSSIKEREKLSDFAKDLFYKDIVKFSNSYNIIIVEYCFKEDDWVELLKRIKGKDVRTIYLKPKSIEEHKKAWIQRSRNFKIRHSGHGATSFSNGIGRNHTNTYESKLILDLPTTERVLEISVEFKPYKLSKGIEEIIEFITEE